MLHTVLYIFQLKMGSCDLSQQSGQHQAMNFFYNVVNRCLGAHKMILVLIINKLMRMISYGNVTSMLLS